MHMYMYDRVAALVHARTRTHTGAAVLRAEAAVCIGELCEYMHKNVCFRVPAPSPSVSILPPAETPLPDPFRTPLPPIPRARTPTYHDDDVVDVIVARVYRAKMSLDLERASRMLTFPARRGMITLMTYIDVGGSAIMCIRAATVLPSRETVDADAR